MSEVTLRPARPEDAEALAGCHVACWREAYGDLVAAARLEPLLDLEQRVERWRVILATPPERLLAEQAGEVIGFAATGPSREPDLDVTTEVYALYVRQASWGTGLGHRLLAATLGDADACLWVLRDNERARRFYAAHGFVPDGTEQPEPHFDIPEIRMVRRRARPG